MNWRAEAESWKAKYQSITSLVEPKHVDAAEKIVEAAARLSAVTMAPFVEVVSQLAYVAWKMKQLEDERP